MPANLQIVAQVVDKASKPLGDIGKNTAKLGENSKASGVSLKALGKIALGTTAALATVGVAAKKAFDLGEQGASIKQTGQSFGFLMTKVGASASLLAQLRTVSKGTISDMDLMSSTATLLAGAQGDLAQSLAGSTPKLLEIAKAAQKLNPALGDTTFLYNSLALGVKRASPMILDNLGLTIRIGQANEAYAQSLGKTVAELTANEMKQALLNETLRAGNVLIAQAGGTTDSATDSYNQLTTAFDNMTDRVKVLVHEGIEPMVASTAALMIQWNEQAELMPFILEAYNKLAGGMDVLDSRMDKFGESTAKAMVASGMLDTEVLELAKSFQEVSVMVAAAGGKTSTATGQIVNHTRVQKEGSKAAHERSELEEQLAIAMGETTRQIVNQENRVAVLTQLLHNEHEAKERSKEETTALVIQIAEANFKLQDMEKALTAVTGATEGTTGATQKFGVALEDISNSADRAMIKVGNLLPVVVDVASTTWNATTISAEWSKQQDLAALAAGDLTQEIIDEKAELERLSLMVEHAKFKDEELNLAWRESENRLQKMTAALNDNSNSLANNAEKLSENKRIQEANLTLSRAVAVATGRETEEMHKLRDEAERWAEAYRNSEGPAKQHALDMHILTSLALREETDRHREWSQNVRNSAAAQRDLNAALRAGGTGGFSSRGTGEAASGLGLPSLAQMREELSKASYGQSAWESSPWMTMGERDVMQEYYKLASGGKPDWDKYFEEVNEQRREEGLPEQTMMDVSPAQKAADLKRHLESGTYGSGPLQGQRVGSIVRIDDQTGQKKLADWAEPLFAGLPMPELQHGGNFIVPAGYNRDNFMMGVSSGERVQVTPAHVTGKNDGGVAINTVNVYGVQTDSQLFDAVTKVARQRGRQFAKVM